MVTLKNKSNGRPLKYLTSIKRIHVYTNISKDIKKILKRIDPNVKMFLLIKHPKYVDYTTTYRIAINDLNVMKELFKEIKKNICVKDIEITDATAIINKKYMVSIRIKYNMKLKLDVYTYLKPNQRAYHPGGTEYNKKIQRKNKLTS